MPLTTSTFLGGRDHITCPKARAYIKVFSPKRFHKYGTIECPQSGYNIPSRSPSSVHSRKHACTLAQYNMEGQSRCGSTHNPGTWEVDAGKSRIHCHP